MFVYGMICIKNNIPIDHNGVVKFFVVLRGDRFMVNVLIMILEFSYWHMVPGPFASRIDVMVYAFLLYSPKLEPKCIYYKHANVYYIDRYASVEAEIHLSLLKKAIASSNI